jgi:hypothetical protein
MLTLRSRSFGRFVELQYRHTQSRDRLPPEEDAKRGHTPPRVAPACSSVQRVALRPTSRPAGLYLHPDNLLIRLQDLIANLHHQAKGTYTFSIATMAVFTEVAFAPHRRVDESRSACCVNSLASPKACLRCVWELPALAAAGVHSR